MTSVEIILWDYSNTKRRVRELELQIDELQAKKQGIYDKLLTPKPPRSEHVAGGPDFDPVVEAVAKLVDVYVARIRGVTRQLEEANEKLAKIEALVNTAELTEIELRYVHLRYFDGMPAWKVAQKLSLSESRARDYKVCALEKIGDRRRFFLVG
jgi:cell division protein ZapA (FtsZ GTPase activity inhibitor)